MLPVQSMLSPPFGESWTSRLQTSRKLPLSCTTESIEGCVTLTSLHSARSNLLHAGTSFLPATLLYVLSTEIVSSQVISLYYLSGEQELLTEQAAIQSFSLACEDLMGD